MKTKWVLCAVLIVLGGLFTTHSFAGSSRRPGELLGITWSDSRLVSFDPFGGTITQVHAYLNPTEAFRGLTYDMTRGRYYALSQGSNKLYSIDPLTLDIVLIGKLGIDHSGSWDSDAGALAYDPASDSLYTAVERWTDYEMTTIWSELCKVDVTTAGLTCIGAIHGPFITSFDYNEDDGYLYGLALYAPGGWDSQEKSYVVRINPLTVDMEHLFVTPYHTILGFAKKPNDDSYIYYSWVNWTSHFYGEVNVSTGIITPLGSSDDVDVISAMVHRKHKEAPISALATVNDFVNTKAVRSTFSKSSDISGCPGYPFAQYAGKLTFQVRIGNISDTELSGLVLKVVALADGTVILNPDGTSGGVGSILPVPKEADFSDGLLTQREVARFPLTICYKQLNPFIFSVDTLAVINPPIQRHVFAVP